MDFYKYLSLYASCIRIARERHVEEFPSWWEIQGSRANEHTPAQVALRQTIVAETTRQTHCPLATLRLQLARASLASLSWMSEPVKLLHIIGADTAYVSSA